MGSPEWGRDPRFATKPDRVANWDALHALMCGWSRQFDKQQIADMAQAGARAELSAARGRRAARLGAARASRVLARGRDRRPHGEGAGAAVRDHLTRIDPLPNPPPHAGEGVRAAAGRARSERFAPLPLSGIRVLDFSWVIAGPTATRYLAAMGAEIIKVEAPGRGDPGRASELHTVLGQGKRGIVLDLKKPEAIDVARRLAARCDVLVENFATGVMDRLGLGADALREVNPGLIYVSASGLGRTGPEARAVAYGTLLQCYSRVCRAQPPSRDSAARRHGVARSDVRADARLCHRRRAVAARAVRRGARGSISRCSKRCCGRWPSRCCRRSSATDRDPVGNRSEHHAPHGVYRCAGDDDWIAHRRDRRGKLAGALRVGAGAGPARRARPRPSATSGKREIDAALAAWARPLSGGRGRRRIDPGRRPGRRARRLARPGRQPASARARLLGEARQRRAARSAVARELRAGRRAGARSRRRYRRGAARNRKPLPGGHSGIASIGRIWLVAAVASAPGTTYD